jgi:hypothetical protein
MKKELRRNRKKITLDTLWAYLYESSRKSDLSYEKREREFKKMQEEARKRSEEFDEKFNKMVQEIGGIGNSNGYVAEEYFINAFKMNPTLNGETYDTVNNNVRLFSDIQIENEQYDDEFDIFLSNSRNTKSLAIIEVKYNAKRGDIKEALEKAENFRKFMPQCKEYKLYLGIAALSFKKITEERVLEKGIAVIKQVGNKTVIHDKNLRVF